MRNHSGSLSTGESENVNDAAEESGLTKAFASVGITPTCAPKDPKRVTDVPPICSDEEEDTLPEGHITDAQLWPQGGAR